MMTEVYLVVKIALKEERMLASIPVHDKPKKKFFIALVHFQI